MEKGCGSWLPRHHFGWQSPKLNYMRDPRELGTPSNVYACMSFHSNVMSSHQTSPVVSFSEQLPVGQANEPHGWFYCFPHYQQAFAAAQISGMKKPSACFQPDLRQAIAPNSEPGTDQKRFLVFDQSRDQTALIYSSLIGNPGQPLNSWSPKPVAAHSLGGEDPGTKTLTHGFDENHGADAESGLHEDTEELNALLYSDDDSYGTQDDEETSTGHSPSTMTIHDHQGWYEGSEEEVASTDGVTKRRKLSSGGFDVSLMDTASSVKPNRYLESNKHTESSFADSSTNCRLEESVPFSGNKRMRKDKISEKLSILQSIVPGGKGKHAVVVLDETIQYLKSLKLKAIALGLKTF